MGFDQYKRAVVDAAKKVKQGHMVPNANALYELWLAKTPVDTVVKQHCTVEAQRRRASALLGFTMSEAAGDS